MELVQITSQIRATETGLILPENLQINDYIEAGNKVHSLHRSTSWMLADLLNYGDSHYGDQFSQIVDNWGYRPETLRNALYVAKRWPANRRNPNLSFAHHQCLTALDDDIADTLLAAAVEKELSVAELRTLKREYLLALNGEPEEKEIEVSKCPNCGYEL